MSLRNLTTDEKRLLERILDHQPEKTVPHIRLPGDECIEEIFADGTLNFRTTRSSKPWYYPVEAVFVDDDGISVSAIVFAVEDEVSMLEILRADGSIPHQKPSLDSWEIIDLSAGFRK